jgi:hypothetical protein
MFFSKGSIDMAKGRYKEFIKPILDQMDPEDSKELSASAAPFLARLLDRLNDNQDRPTNVHDLVTNFDKHGLVLTPSAVRILNRILLMETLARSGREIMCEGGNLNELCVFAHPVLNLIGPPGVGKTYVCEVAAKIVGRPFARISCCSSTSWDDLFGMGAPVKNEQNQISFKFQEGVLVQALREGALILLDEVNLLSEDLLYRLVELLDQRIIIHPRTGFKPELIVRDRVVDLSAKSPMIVCAMNPPSVGGGRQELPLWFARYLCKAEVGSFDEQELKKVV